MRATLAQLATHASPVPAAVRAALEALPADRAIGFVVDRASGDDFSATLGLPRGTGLVGSLRVDATGVGFDASADPHDVALATRVEAQARPQLAPLALLADVALTRQGSVLRVAGHLSDAMLLTLSSNGFGK